MAGLRVETASSDIAQATRVVMVKRLQVCGSCSLQTGEIFVAISDVRIKKKKYELGMNFLGGSVLLHTLVIQAKVGQKLTGLFQKILLHLIGWSGPRVYTFPFKKQNLTSSSLEGTQRHTQGHKAG